MACPQVCISNGGVRERFLMETGAESVTVVFLEILGKKGERKEGIELVGFYGDGRRRASSR